MSDVFLTLLQEVRDEQKRFAESFTEQERALKNHIEESRARHAEIITGFPGGDLEGHRRYHAAVIERLELRNKMIRECLLNAAKVGTVAGFGWVLYAIWISFKMELKI